MSLSAFPFVFLNLGGEMVYIIEQRLNAQRICPFKAEKVLNEILRAMFEAVSSEAVFEHKPLKNRDYLQQLFQRIAHSSIMKLNEQSMSKLLELMIMVYKYQVVFSLSGSDMYEMTLNHVNCLLLLAKQSPVQEMILAAREKFTEKCAQYDERQYQIIRQTILNYFIDIKTRVSIFLREKSQQLDGSFVLVNNQGLTLCKGDIPGKILYYDNKQQLSGEAHFDPGAVYVQNRSRTTLGCNIYGKDEDSPKTPAEEAEDGPSNVEEVTEPEDTSAEAKKEFLLLSTMLGRRQSVETVKIDLNFGIEEAEPEEKPSKVKTIEANREHENLTKISMDFAVNRSEDPGESDLLQLIDMNS